MTRLTQLLLLIALLVPGVARADSNTPADFLPHVTLYLPTADLSRMTTDSADTTRPTAAGDAIYNLDDPGGNVFNTSADSVRPLLRSDATRKGSLHFFNDAGNSRRFNVSSSLAFLNHVHVTGQATILFWIKFDSATNSTAEYIIDNANGSSGSYGFSIHRDTSERMSISIARANSPAGLVLSINGPTITDTSWHRVVIKVGAGSGACSVQVDSGAATTGTLSTLATNNASFALRLGNRANNTDLPANCQLSELVISAAALTAEEIAAWAAYNPDLGDLTPADEIPATSEWLNVSRNPTAPLAARGSTNTHDPTFIAGTMTRSPQFVWMGARLVVFYTVSQATGDGDGHGMLFQISENGGHTWSPPKTALRFANFLYNTRWINPGCFGWDAERERMHFIYTVGEDTTVPNEGTPDVHTCFYTYSDDPDLITWSTPVDITTQVNPNGDDYLIFGISPMIKVQAGPYAGYMLAAMHQRAVFGGTAYSCLAFLPPDGDAEDWDLGARADRTDPINDGANESQLIELRDTSGNYTGEFYMNCRIVAANDNQRLQYRFSDPTAEFLPDGTIMTDGTNPCLADATLGSCLSDSAGNLLVVVPRSTHFRRSGMQVWRSTNPSNANPTFTALRMPVEGECAYTCIEETSPGHYVIAYESTNNVEEEGDSDTPREYLRLKHVSLAELLTPLSTNPSTMEFMFNEAASGTMSAMGAPIYNHGTVGQPIQTKGCTGWTWGNGHLESAGTGTGLILASLAYSSGELYGGPWDWRNDSLSVGYRLYLPSGKSDGDHTLVDNRSDGAGQGRTLKLVVSGTGAVYTLSLGWNDDASGNQTHTLVAPKDQWFTLWEIRDKTAGAVRLRIDNDDGVFTGNTATTDTQASVIGTLKHTLGAQAGGNEKLGFRISHLKFVRGVAYSDAQLTSLATVTKRTPYQLFRYTPNYAELLPASWSDCLLAVGCTFDGGYGVGTDYYGGGWDKGVLPVKEGQGAGSLRCVKTGKCFRQSSLSRNAYWVRDQHAGMMLRMNQNAGATAAPFIRASDVNGAKATDTAYDVVQNSGNFAISCVVRFNSTQTGYILANRSEGGSVPGVEFAFTGTTLNLTLRDTTGQIINEAGWPAIFRTNRTYYLGVSGSAGAWSGGAANKLQLYYGQIMDGVVPALSSATGTGTMSLGTEGASTSALHVFSRAMGTPSGQVVGAFKNCLLFNRPLTLAEHQEWAALALNDVGLSRESQRNPRLSIGIGNSLSSVERQSPGAGFLAAAQAEFRLAP